MNRKWSIRLCAAICAVLLCAGLAGCMEADPGTSGTSSTPAVPEPTPSVTHSTVPVELTYTVKLVTRGGMPLEKSSIAIYADAACTQLITYIHTDENGIATYTGLSGSTYYMVTDEMLQKRGFVSEAYYTVTEAYSELIMDMMPSSKNHNAKLGDVMCELDYTDWKGQQFVLSERVKLRKPCIIYNPRSDYSDELLALLQKVYDKYSNRLEVLLFTNQGTSEQIQWVWQSKGVTFPGVGVYRYGMDWANASDIVVVDRYGRMAMIEKTDRRVDEETLQAIVDYFIDPNYRQDRVFESVKDFWEYLDSRTYTEEATYQVKVVDGNGKPLPGVQLVASYRFTTVLAETDEQGIATFTLPKRDDISVELSGDYGMLASYIIENDGLFEPGSTEKTIIRRERD